MSASTTETTIQWKEHGEALAQGVSDFYRNEYLTDTNVTFYKDTMKVHRFILAMFLPAFKRSLDFALMGRANGIQPHDFKELNLDLVADDSNDVKSLVEFIYTGKVTVSNERLSHLKQLAKDLNFEGLSEAIGDGGVTNIESTETENGSVEDKLNNHVDVGCHEISTEGGSIGTWTEDGVSAKFEESSILSAEQEDDFSQQPMEVILVEQPSCTNWNVVTNEEEKESTNAVEQREDYNPTCSNSLTTSNMHKCGKCSKIFLTTNSLTFHYKFCGRIFCRNCWKTFTSHASLKRHMKAMHGINIGENPLPGDSVIECIHCDFVCYNEHKLLYHIKSKHPDLKNKTYDCVECKFSTTVWKELNTHVKMRHRRSLGTKLSRIKIRKGRKK